MGSKLSPQELAMRIVREHYQYLFADRNADLVCAISRIYRSANEAIETYKDTHRLSRAKRGTRWYVTDAEIGTLLAILGVYFMGRCGEDPYASVGSAIVQAKLENFLEELKK